MDSDISKLNLNSLKSISVEPFQNAMKSTQVKTLIDNFLSRDFYERNFENIAKAVHLVEEMINFYYIFIYVVSLKTS